MKKKNVVLAGFGGYGGGLIDLYLKDNVRIYGNYLKSDLKALYKEENELNKFYNTFFRAIWVDRTGFTESSEEKGKEIVRGTISNLFHRISSLFNSEPNGIYYEACEGCRDPETCNEKIKRGRCFIHVYYHDLVQKESGAINRLTTKVGLTHCPEIHHYVIEKMDKLLKRENKRFVGNILYEEIIRILFNGSTPDFWVFNVGLGGGVGTGLISKITDVADNFRGVVISTLTETKEREAQQAPFIKRSFNTIFALIGLIQAKKPLILVNNELELHSEIISRIIDSLLNGLIGEEIERGEKEETELLFENEKILIPVLFDSYDEFLKWVKGEINELRLPQSNVDINSADRAILFVHGLRINKKEIKEKLKDKLKVNEIIVISKKLILKNKYKKGLVVLFLEDPSLVGELLERKCDGMSRTEAAIKFASCYYEIIRIFNNFNTFVDVENIFKDENKLKSVLNDDLIEMHNTLREIQKNKFKEGVSEKNFNGLDVIFKVFRDNIYGVFGRDAELSVYFAEFGKMMECIISCLNIFYLSILIETKLDKLIKSIQEGIYKDFDMFIENELDKLIEEIQKRKNESRWASNTLGNLNKLYYVFKFEGNGGVEIERECIEINVEKNKLKEKFYEIIRKWRNRKLIAVKSDFYGIEFPPYTLPEVSVIEREHDVDIITKIKEEIKNEIMKEIKKIRAQ